MNNGKAKNEPIEFSIIIPVYNAEQYLEECLESIERQTLPNFEVILVDDGSSDSSLDICRAFSKCDSRFIVIEQENAGTSAARNTGIRASSGKYITFIDNDDFWMSGDALAQLLQVAQKTDADLIIHESIVYDDETDSFDPITQKEGLAKTIDESDKARAIELLEENGLIASAVWTKACKREVVIDNDLFFPTGMRNEDTYWTGRALLYCKSIAWCDCVFYAYRKNHSYAQTSHSLKVSHINDLAIICELLAKEIKDEEANISEKHALFSFLAYRYFILLGQTGLLPKDRYQHTELQESVDHLSWLLDYDDNPNVHRAKLLKHLVGLSMLQRILGKALKRRYPNLVIEAD